MLRLPIPSSGLDAGCNFAAALCLISLLAGVSAIRYEGLLDGEAFATLLRQYYPWNLEPKDEEVGSVEDRIDALWNTFRNPLAHSLGMPFKKLAPRQRVLERARFWIFINKESQQWTEQRVMGLEHGESRARPEMHPAIAATEDMHMLSVEALYWGIRVLMARVLNDNDAVNELDRRLSLPPVSATPMP